MLAVFQGRTRVAAGVHGVHDQSRDRERPVQLGGGAGVPRAHVWRQALHHLTGTLLRTYSYLVYCFVVP